jgi:hypothetical protein
MASVGVMLKSLLLCPSLPKDIELPKEERSDGRSPLSSRHRPPLTSRIFVIFHTKSFSYDEEIVAPQPVTKLEDHHRRLAYTA